MDKIELKKNFSFFCEETYETMVKLKKGDKMIKNGSFYVLISDPNVKISMDLVNDFWKSHFKETKKVLTKK
jgi:hypothetical protein